MEIVQVKLHKEVDNSYSIIVGENLIPIIVLDLKKNLSASKYCIITDSIVSKLFGKKLLNELKKHELNAFMISFPVGEKSKNLKTFVELQEKLAVNCLDRDSIIIALGGGVVGDVAGFVAATYMRGIRLVQIPTTLLSMVDSSIGGKTGIDLIHGKNLVGVFSQPKRVFIDVSFLKTLPEKELKNGLAEVIKTAVIGDKKLFNLLEKKVRKALRKDRDSLIQIISECCKFKAKIVELDEFEKNLRKILNYGHTVGHAIESATNYKKFSHGQAIAIGMAIEGKIAVNLNLMDNSELQLQNSLLKKAGLSLRLPKISKQKLWSEMQKDKKACFGEVKMVFPERIGLMKKLNGAYAITVSKKIFYDSLK